MFIIVSAAGCLPYLNLEIDEDGNALIFGTKKKAEKYARKNCAWEYRIYEWQLTKKENKNGRTLFCKVQLRGNRYFRIHRQQE